MRQCLWWCNLHMFSEEASCQSYVLWCYMSKLKYFYLDLTGLQLLFLCVCVVWWWWWWWEGVAISSFHHRFPLVSGTPFPLWGLNFRHQHKIIYYFGEYHLISYVVMLYNHNLFINKIDALNAFVCSEAKTWIRMKWNVFKCQIVSQNYQHDTMQRAWKIKLSCRAKSLWGIRSRLLYLDLLTAL